MASSYEQALWAVEDAKREYHEAEASGDYEAMLIWKRSIAEAVAEAETVFRLSGSKILSRTIVGTANTKNA